MEQQLSVIRNPKQDGSIVYDCIPQTGPCPNRCNECFYNRPGAFYTDIMKPSVPRPEELPAGAIVRMNSGHDSNLHKGLVLETAKQYRDVFFNTSIPKYDFPGPVVLTINPKEDEGYTKPIFPLPRNIMFVRIRVSPANWRLVDEAVAEWTAAGVPVVLTFMRYYSMAIPEYVWPFVLEKPAFEFKKNVLNTYWCPTHEFEGAVMRHFEHNRLVSMCGSYETSRCTACRNCETHYLQAKKRLRGE